MKIKAIKRIVLGFFILGIPLLPLKGLAVEKFPSRPMTIICPYTPGGSWDIYCRFIAEDMKKDFGVPVEVMNKAGATGIVGFLELLKSKPDGHTMGQVGTAVMTEQLVRKTSYNILRDATPVANFSGTQYGIAVRSDSPWKTYHDLIEYARQNPGVVKYAVSGLLAPQNLSMITIAHLENIKWTAVPVKGHAEGMAALLGGHVPLYSGSMSMYPQVAAGKIRILAIHSAESFEKMLPGVPCLLDVGVPKEYAMPLGWGGYFVPKGVPPERVEVLDRAIKKTLERPDVIEAMQKHMSPPIYKSSEELLRTIDDFTEYTKRALAFHK